MERVFSTPTRRPRASHTSYSRHNPYRSNPLFFGDTIYVRVSMGGRIKKEFVTTRVADMTEVLGEIRYHTKDLSGLAHISVRNATRGWNLERPLMLYANFPAPRTSAPLRQQPLPHTIFPYETH